MKAEYKGSKDWELTVFSDDNQHFVKLVSHGPVDFDVLRCGQAANRCCLADALSVFIQWVGEMGGQPVVIGDARPWMEGAISRLPGPSCAADNF